MKLNPQAIKILDILDTGGWHCCSEWHYADGHCKRISDINEYLKPQGKKVIGEVCKCGRHTAKVYKRMIVPLDTQSPRLAPILATTEAFLKRWEVKPLKNPQQLMNF